MCKICKCSACPATCPNADPPKVIGNCAQCGCELTADETFFEDSESNAFCTKSCALEHYGVEEAEFNG